MKNTFDMTAMYALLPEKETKNCYRYAHVGGAHGISTPYLQKSAVSGPAPARLAVRVITSSDLGGE